jgi:hypothetical protein
VSKYNGIEVIQMADKRRQQRRESAMLILGVVMGGFFSMIGSLWAAYYVEWYKSVHSIPDWTLLFVGTSIGLSVLIFYLFWQIKKLRE